LGTRVVKTHWLVGKR